MSSDRDEGKRFGKIDPVMSFLADMMGIFLMGPLTVETAVDSGEDNSKVMTVLPVFRAEKSPRFASLADSDSLPELKFFRTTPEGGRYPPNFFGRTLLMENGEIDGRSADLDALSRGVKFR